MTLPESPTPAPPGMVRLRVVDSVAVATRRLEAAAGTA